MGVLRSDPFYSVLIVGEMWALGDVQDPRVPRLMALIRDVIQVIRLEGNELDVAVAELGGWTVDTVRQYENATQCCQVRPLSPFPMRFVQN